MPKNNLKYLNAFSIMIVVAALVMSAVTISKAQVGGTGTTDNASSTSGASSTNSSTTTSGGGTGNDVSTSSDNSSNTTNTSNNTNNVSSSTTASSTNESTTTDATATSTATSTNNSNDANVLQMEISRLQTQLGQLLTQLNMFWQRLQNLVGGNNNNATSTDFSGSKYEPSGPPEVMPMNETVSPGSSINWSGRNFMGEEDIDVTMNGQTVAKAHADGGGNFSTGSVSVPNQMGTYTYTFSGNKGDNVIVYVNVRSNNLQQQ